jgi:hypothetical protein
MVLAAMFGRELPDNGRTGRERGRFSRHLVHRGEQEQRKMCRPRAAASANGTVVQQYACNGTTSQQWQFETTSNGYFRIDTRNNPAQVLDVTGVSTADGGLVQLWAYGGGNNQQWQAVEQSTGAYHLITRNNGKCLDVPGASLADSVQLQQYTCNNTGAQSYTLVPVAADPPPSAGNPDLGPNVSIFDPSMSSATIQSRLNQVSSQQETNQFGRTGMRCCSSRVRTTSTPMSASSPKSPDWASPRMTSPSTVPSTRKPTGFRATPPRTSGGPPETCR